MVHPILSPMGLKMVQPILSPKWQKQMKLIPSTPLSISRLLLPLKPHPSTTAPLPHGGARSHAMDSLHHYLVDHPTLANFEWKQGHTWGASTQFLTLTIFCYLTLTYLLSHSQIPPPPPPPPPTTGMLLSSPILLHHHSAM